LTGRRDVDAGGSLQTPDVKQQWMNSRTLAMGFRFSTIEPRFQARDKLAASRCPRLTRRVG
ncbi:MAG: hypothetical protein WD648_09725, partial [Planctomycetaceae bacterium]